MTINTDDFTKIMEDHVFPHEGGLVNHPMDPGGLTNMGITWATYKRFWNGAATREKLRDMNQEEAKVIYKVFYWNAVRANELPRGLNAIVFDSAINSGPRNAIKALQRAIIDTSTIDIAVDGVYGPQTKEALEATIATHNVRDIIQAYSARRMFFYGLLKTFRPDRTKRFSGFGLGWSRRLSAITRLAYELVEG